MNLPLNGGLRLFFANDTDLYQMSKQNTGEQHIRLGFRFLRPLTSHTKLIIKRGLTFGQNQLKSKCLTTVSFLRFKGSDTRAEERGEDKTRI